jgi:hypothetical protein
VSTQPPSVWLIGLTAILISGCKMSDMGPDCRHAAHRGTFMMNPESKLILPYDSTVSRIVLSDSAGIEHVIEVDHYYEGLTKYIDPDNDTCFSGNVVLFEVESVSMRLSMWEFGMTFQIFLMPECYFDEMYALEYISDGLYLDLTAHFLADDPKTIVGITTDPRTNPFRDKDTPDLDSLIIHDKLFTDVYVGRKLDEDSYDLYYNAMYGIVGIENASRSVSLKYERVE